jgi:hypothetical protein
MGAADSAQRLAAWCGLRKREALRRRERLMVSEEPTNLAREVRVRWATAAKISGEKMGRAWRERFGVAFSHFGADANLARRAVRGVARVPRKRVVRDPWGSVMVADAWRLPRLENFRFSGGDSGELLLPNFLERNSFRR